MEFASEKRNSAAKIKDIILTGSLSNYNWSKYSDLDVHVLFDFTEVSQSDDKEFVREYVNSRKVNWNEIHDITVKGFEVEMYPQDVHQPHRSTGIYSILNDEWVNEPIRREFHVDYDCVREKAEQIMGEIDKLYSEVNK
mgnify:CR=1 FL=1